MAVGHFNEVVACSSRPATSPFQATAFMSDQRTQPSEQRSQADADEHAAVPAWAELWHLRFVLMPRRSIAGRLVSGLVWRRYNGRRWIYKRFTEFDDRGSSS
jgi:hypothetical protein